MKSKIAAIVLLLLSLFALSAPARAGSEDVRALRQLAARMEQTVAAYEARGWWVHDFSPTWINNGAGAEFTIRLNAGDDMIFRGMGDGDAADLDIKVFSPGGRLLGHDSDYDPTPVVNLRAPRAGTYRIRVTLASCRTNGSYCGLIAAER